MAVGCALVQKVTCNDIHVIDRCLIHIHTWAMFINISHICTTYVPLMYTHTHTPTQIERERERSALESSFARLESCDPHTEPVSSPGLEVADSEDLFARVAQ